MMEKHLTIGVVLYTIFINVTVSSASECDAVLKFGLWETREEASSSSTDFSEQRVLKQLQRNNYKIHSSTNAFGISNDFSKLKSSFSSKDLNFKQKLDASNEFNLSMKKASKNIVQAWTDCMNGQAGGTAPIRVYASKGSKDNQTRIQVNYNSYGSKADNKITVDVIPKDGNINCDLKQVTIKKNDSEIVHCTDTNETGGELKISNDGLDILNGIVIIHKAHNVSRVEVLAEYKARLARSYDYFRSNCQANDVPLGSVALRHLNYAVGENFQKVNYKFEELAKTLNINLATERIECVTRFQRCDGAISKTANFFSTTAYANGLINNANDPNIGVQKKNAQDMLTQLRNLDTTCYRF